MARACSSLGRRQRSERFTSGVWPAEAALRLPAMRHSLAQYDALLDVLVEALVREIEESERNNDEAPGRWQAIPRASEVTTHGDPTLPPS